MASTTDMKALSGNDFRKGPQADVDTKFRRARSGADGRLTAARAPNTKTEI